MPDGAQPEYTVVRKVSDRYCMNAGCDTGLQVFWAENWSGMGMVHRATIENSSGLGVM